VEYDEDQNVNHLAFHHVRAQHAANVPVFVMKSVDNFRVQASPEIPNAWLAHVEKKSFWLLARACARASK
jgi:hypothetical protein